MLYFSIVLTAAAALVQITGWMEISAGTFSCPLTSYHIYTITEILNHYNRCIRVEKTLSHGCNICMSSKGNGENKKVPRPSTICSYPTKFSLVVNPDCDFHRERRLHQSSRYDLLVLEEIPQGKKNTMCFYNCDLPKTVTDS